MSTTVYNPYSADTILSNIGSFWFNSFSDYDRVQTLTNASVSLYDQLELDQLDLLAVMSRFEIPVFKKENWKLFTPNNLDISKANKKLYTLNGEISLGAAVNLGDLKTSDNWSFSIDSTIKDIQYITDSPSNPKIILVKDLDFYIEDSQLVLYKNISTLGFATRPGLNNTTEYKLWLSSCDLDLNYVYEQFGYVLNLYIGSSSEAYKDLVNAAFDTLILGSNSRCFRVAVASLLGIKLVSDPLETVEDIKYYGTYTLVITNSNVYSFNSTETITVAIGDVVIQGDTLTDSLHFYELDKLSTIQPAIISGLFVEPSSTGLGIKGYLTFTNNEVSTTYSTDSAGFVDVRFAIGGSSSDLTTFWTSVESIGRSTGNSIAQALRINQGATNQPFRSEIPSTVNPMKFLLDSVYKSNAILVKLSVQSSILNALNDLSLLRRLVPAHISVIFIIEIVMDTEVSNDPTEPSVATLGFIDQSGPEIYSSSVLETVTTSYLDS